MARRAGLWAALPRIAGELAGLPFHRLQFRVLRRALDVPFPPAKARLTLEIRRFEHADLSEAARIHRPSEARLCARRLAAGQYGLAALTCGDLAGYAWACAESDPDLERVPLALDPGEALCTDAYTDPVWRGQGVQSALTLARFQLLKTLGFNQTLSYILIGNKPSLSVWQNKLGSEIIGEFTFIRFGPWVKLSGSGEFINRRMRPVQRGRLQPV